MKPTEESRDLVEVMPTSALSALESAILDRQIVTAKQYPRSLKKFHDKAMEYATLDEETAASCFYKLKRRGKDGTKEIEGPSVRLAEIVAATYGNIRAESDIIEEGEKFVTAMGSAIDLESNFAVRVRVKRRITTSDGRRFNDDLIAVTSNAAASIALREALFKVVPRALVKPIYQRAKEVAIGDQKTLASRRQSAVDWFVKAGASEKEVYAMLGVNGMDDITLSHLETLTGVRSAIKDNEITLESALHPPADEETEQQEEKLSVLQRKLETKKAELKQVSSDQTPADEVEKQGVLL
jgi:transposase